MNQVCSFTVGELEFGLDVLLVQEILRWKKVTSVPLAPPYVRGLVNLRGRILTMLDLREWFGLAPRPVDMEGMIVVADGPDGTIGLCVDRVGDVIDLPGTIDPPPPHLDGVVRESIRGIFQQSERLLLLLDPKTLGVASAHRPEPATLTPV
jgi:purine-binding chemotaxis protein CheW